MDLHFKTIQGLERIAEVIKTLLWEKAKVHGISPIQIQILLFVSDHSIELSNVSNLAKEFNITKPTISDAVKVLISKGYLAKDHSLTDNRRFNLTLSRSGTKLIQKLSDYALPIASELLDMKEDELQSFFKILTSLIYKLNQKGIIAVQRTCYGCRHYQGNKKNKHHCNLLEKKLFQQDIRLDCPEFTSN